MEESAGKLEEQDTNMAWQAAMPTVANSSNKPMNLRRKSGMAVDSLNGQ